MIPVTCLPCALPYIEPPVSAGFPSPAADYEEQELDLGELLVRNKAATFLMRAKGVSMLEAGILDGDLLVVDRSVRPVSGSIVVATLNGEHTVKFLRRRAGRVYLEAANPEYPAIEVTEDEDLVIFGVVMHAIHSLVRG